MKFFKYSILPSELFLFAVVVLVSFLLRAYNFSSEYGFYGDQGQDLLAINNWFKTGEIPKVGILTSIGTFHMGPLYYYLIAPFVLIFRGDPIGPVVLFLISGVAIPILSYIFFKEFLGYKEAFLGSLLFALSPHAIFVSKGAYSPNLQILTCLFLIYCVLKFIKTEKGRYLFLAYLSVGIGIQFHYNFLANLITLTFILVLFKRKEILNIRYFIYGFMGFSIPLLPFLIGQVKLNYEDIKGIHEYLITPKPRGSFKFIVDRLVFPFSIYFPVDKLPWFFALVVKPFFILIIFTAMIISFLKNKMSREVRVILAFYISSVFLAIYMDLNYWWWYTDFFSVSALLLVCLVITYLYRSKRLKSLWIGVFAIFIWWEIFQIPSVYGIGRSPLITKHISTVIADDVIKSNIKSPIGVISLNSITPKEAYEYRYLLERDGVATKKISEVDMADYVIVESSSKQDVDEQLVTLGFINLQSMEFNNGSKLVKFVSIYKIR